jgi:hypothetical protein
VSGEDVQWWKGKVITEGDTHGLSYWVSVEQKRRVRQRRNEHICEEFS